jgi:uncharacterized protein involved in exopolysaccharide biosynthesis
MTESTVAEVPLADEPAGKDVREYIAVVRRRKFEIAGVATLVAAITLVVAIALPPVFRSTATILVQEQEIPPDLVRSTITSYADERIQVISQQVMTRAVLLQLIDRFDLYRKYRGHATVDEVIDRMRKDIKLTTVDASVSDRSSGQRVNSTIAFHLSYDAPRPEPAQQVVEALVTLYLNENVKARQQSVAETTAFLEQEAARVAEQLRDTEARLAEFKRRNAGALPDSMNVNMQLAERTNADLQRVDRDISLLEDRREGLQRQLTLIDPHLPVPVVAVAGADAAQKSATPEERLRALKAQYAASIAIYSTDHPDVKRLAREIAALELQVGDAAPAAAADRAPSNLAQLEAQLAALRKLYAADHPDIQRLTRTIAALRTQGAGTSASPVPGSAGNPGVDGGAAAVATAGAAPAATPAKGRARPPDNPAYVALVTQIDTVRRELTQLAAQRNDLRARQRSYDARLMQIPEVEREYRELTRDYDNAQTRYREIRAKQMQAAVAQELERDRKAERFSVGEPANLPERPVSPNRLRIVLAGLAGALVAGFGLAFVHDALDPSIKGPLDLARLVSVPILTAIPYIETRHEHAGRVRRNVAMMALFLIAGAAFLAAIHVYLKPLPVALAAARRALLPW